MSYTPEDAARLSRKAKRKRLEDLFAAQVAALRCPAPEREYHFHPARKWAFDFAWPALLLAVEVEGGQWVRGRHQRGKGFADDCEKYNAAAALGWTVLRFTGSQVECGAAFMATVEILREGDGRSL